MRVEFSAAAVSGVVRAFRSPAVFLPTGPATKMRRAAQAEGGGGGEGGSPFWLKHSLRLARSEVVEESERVGPRCRYFASGLNI